MQIIFDSRYDGLQEARTMLALLETYIDCHPAQKAATGVNTHDLVAAKAPEIRGNVTSATSAETLSDAAAVPQPQAASAPPPPPPAPSDADAAQSQTAPVASTVGAPPPPPASPPPAPAASVPTASAAPTSPVVDVTGLPWDERIHAANKATVANGQWRKKKGLNDAAYIAAVTAELRAAYPVTATAPAAPAPFTHVTAPESAAVAAIAPPPPAPPAAATTEVAAPPPPAQAATAAPPPPSASEPSLMEWLGDAMSKGKVQFPAVMEEVVKLGAKTLADFASNPAFTPLAPVLMAALKARHSL